MNRDARRLDRDLSAGARKFVRWHSLNLLCRKDRRHLVDLCRGMRSQLPQVPPASSESAVCDAVAPSASKVSVAKPNRILPSYHFSDWPKNCASRVYLPSSRRQHSRSHRVERSQVTNRRSPVARRTMATTSCEVMPAGLSTTRSPFIPTSSLTLETAAVAPYQG